MKENIESRIKILKQKELNLIIEVSNLEKTAIDKKAELVSVRGGILELRLLLQDIGDDTDKVIIEESIQEVKEAEEEE